MQDLNEVVTTFGFPKEAREYVLPDLMYMFIMVWGEFLLLLTYGVISPYAALAIGVNICSQLYVTRASICRYYYLQFLHDKDDMNTEKDHKHLEAICDHCQKKIHLILWPGVTISSILFSLYLFDMAYDVDNPPDALGESLTIMLLTLAAVPCAAIIYHYSNKRAQQTLESRVSEIVELPELGRVQNPMNDNVNK